MSLWATGTGWRAYDSSSSISLSVLPSLNILDSSTIHEQTTLELEYSTKVTAIHAFEES